MFLPNSLTAFRNITAAGDSALRRAMTLGALFGSACQGGVSLTRALAALRHEADADALTLVRVRTGEAPVIIATTTAQVTALDDDVAGRTIALCAEPALLRAGQMTAEPQDASTCTVVVAADDACVDLLIVRGGQPTLLCDFAAMAAPIWSARRAGVVETAMLDLARIHGPQDDTPAVSGNLLGSANPANLTPTELRVAACLRDGLSPALIGQTLDIAMPTVRTHLRNIYAKTGLRGLQEVCHRLHTDAV